MSGKRLRYQCTQVFMEEYSSGMCLSWLYCTMAISRARMREGVKESVLSICQSVSLSSDIYWAKQLLYA